MGSVPTTASAWRTDFVGLLLSYVLAVLQAFAETVARLLGLRTMQWIAISHQLAGARVPAEGKPKGSN